MLGAARWARAFMEGSPQIPSPPPASAPTSLASEPHPPQEDEAADPASIPISAASDPKSPYKPAGAWAKPHQLSRTLAQTVKTSPGTVDAPSERSSKADSLPATVAPPKSWAELAKTKPTLPAPATTIETSLSKTVPVSPAPKNSERESESYTCETSSQPQVTECISCVPSSLSPENGEHPSVTIAPPPASDTSRTKIHGTDQPKASPSWPAPRASSVPANRNYNKMMEEALLARPIVRQLRGLHNRGNLCFANAVLQCLLACPPFYRFLRLISPASVPASTPTLAALVELAHEFVHHDVDPVPAPSPAADAKPPPYSPPPSRAGYAVTPQCIHPVVSRFAPTDPVAPGTPPPEHPGQPVLSCVAAPSVSLSLAPIPHVLLRLYLQPCQSLSLPLVPYCSPGSWCFPPSAPPNRGPPRVFHL